MIAMVDINRAFADRLRSVMQERGITIVSLARAAGMHAPSVSNVLRGVEKCTLERAQRLAEALNVPLSELLEKNSDTQD